MKLKKRLLAFSGLTLGIVLPLAAIACSSQTFDKSSFNNFAVTFNTSNVITKPLSEFRSFTSVEEWKKLGNVTNDGARLNILSVNASPQGNALIIAYQLIAPDDNNLRSNIRYFRVDRKVN